MSLPTGFDWEKPFECRGGTKLEVGLLSSEEKTWIARRVVDGAASAADLGKRLGLSRYTISRWASKIRAGGVIEKSVGRPRTLDTISIGHVLKSLQINHDQGHQTMSRE